MSLSPGTFRTHLESAAKGKAVSRTGRERYGTGEDRSAEAEKSGSDGYAASASQGPSSPQGSVGRAAGAAGAARLAAASLAAAVSSRYKSQTARGRSKTARRGRSSSMSLSPNFLRAASTRFNLAGVRGTSAREMGQQPPSNAIGHVDSEPQQQESLLRDTLAAGTAVERQPSPPPSPPRPRRRRVSISLSSSYVREAVGLGSDQVISGGGGGGSTSKTTDVPQHRRRGKSVDISSKAVLSLRVRPSPISIVTGNRRRGSTSLSPTAVRAAMRSDIARDSSGIGSGNTSNSDLHAGSEQPTLSIRKSTATAELDSCSSPTDPRLQRRRRRFSCRSATSFSLGAGAAVALKSAITMNAPGGGDKLKARKRNSGTTKAMAAAAETAYSEAVDRGSPDAFGGHYGGGRNHRNNTAAAPATGDGVSIPNGSRSLLDIVRVWTRPELLKGLQER